MFPQLRYVRSLPRYRRIVTVLARHGFGSVLEYLQLDRYLSLPARILRQAPALPISPAEHLRQALEELGPTFVKLGQVLSTRPDLLPPDFIAELSKLRDAVAASPWATVQQQLTEAYGDALEKTFMWVDPQPLGSASLAQVHAAALPDGSEVVLKVQRPGIKKIIESDLEILHDLASLAERTPLGVVYDPREIVSEFSFTLRNELDYRREGSNADRFRRNFLGERYIYIPKIYWEHSGPIVLVLERLHGVKLDDLAGLEAAGYDRHQVALNATRIMVKELLEDGFFHADPHPGNFLVMPGEVIGAMDFGMVGHLTEHDRLNLIRFYAAVMQLNASEVVEQLLRMGAVRGRVDRLALERDIRHLLNKYYGLPLKDIRAGDVLDEVVPIAFHHRLRLPSDLWLFAKAVIVMEGVGQQLDPHMDVFAVFEPYARRLLQDSFLPKHWAPDLIGGAEAWSYLVGQVPRLGLDLFRNIERGESPFLFRFGANKETLDRLDQLTTRLSISLLIAGLIIGVASLLSIAATNQVLLPLTVLGFLFILGLGVWFIVSILRTGK